MIFLKPWKGHYRKLGEKYEKQYFVNSNLDCPPISGWKRVRRKNIWFYFFLQETFYDTLFSSQNFDFYVFLFLTPFLEGSNILYKIWPLNDFSVRRFSYQLKAEECKNLRTFDFFNYWKYFYWDTENLFL